MRRNALSGRFGCNPHLEKRRGTHTQGKEYCNKEETRIDGPFVYGDDNGIPETQGARSDLVEVKRKLDSGASMKSIADDHFSDYIRYHKSFRAYKRLKAVHRNWEMEVIVLFGLTGTGKTKFVYDNYGDSLYSVPDAKSSGTYWDDYDGEYTVLIDEMYGKRFSHGVLLRLLDRYQVTVPVHGSSVNFSSHRIVMTSNVHPREWYHAMYEKTNSFFEGGPLHRRMVQGDSCVIECTIVNGEFRKRMSDYNI